MQHLIMKKKHLRLHLEKIHNVLLEMISTFKAAGEVLLAHYEV